MKTCTKCGEVKALDCFSRNKAAKDGRQSYCKPCSSSRSVAWAKANTEKMKAFHNAYYRANSEKIKARNAAWREANPEKMKALSVAYYIANREKVTVRSTVWAKANPEKVKALSVAYYKDNLEKAKVRAAAWAKANPGYAAEHGAKHRLNLSQSYVAHALGIPVAKLTPELLELKREQLTIRRLSREIKNTLKSLKEKA